MQRGTFLIFNPDSEIHFTQFLNENTLIYEFIVIARSKATKQSFCSY